MLKIKHILLLIFFYTLSAIAQHVEFSPKRLDGFRNAKFGMTKKEVMRVEKAKAVNNTPLDFQLNFKGTYINLQCYFDYVFYHDSLVKGTIEFTKIYNDKNRYIENYNDVVMQLRKFYGEPAISEQLWKNLINRDNKEMCGRNSYSRPTIQ